MYYEGLKVCRCSWWRRLISWHREHPRIVRSRYAPGSEI